MKVKERGLSGSWYCYCLEFSRDSSPEFEKLIESIGLHLIRDKDLVLSKLPQCIQLRVDLTLYSL